MGLLPLCGAASLAGSSPCRVSAPPRAAEGPVTAVTAPRGRVLPRRGHGGPARPSGVPPLPQPQRPRPARLLRGRARPAVAMARREATANQGAAGYICRCCQRPRTNGKATAGGPRANGEAAAGGGNGPERRRGAASAGAARAGRARPSRVFVRPYEPGIFAPCRNARFTHGPAVEGNKR